MIITELSLKFLGEEFAEYFGYYWVTRNDGVLKACASPQVSEVLLSDLQKHALERVEERQLLSEQGVSHNFPWTVFSG